jgi:putative ABC transport system permease protein
LSTLWRLSLRWLARHRGQSLLLLISVALGVAVVVAIDLANQSARRSFALTAQSLSGQATHHLRGGPAGLDEALYHKLRVDLGVQSCAPVVEGLVTATVAPAGALAGTRRTLRLLGLDPFAERDFRHYVADPSQTPLADLSAMLVEPDTVLLSADLARALAVASGGSFGVEVGARHVTLRVAGLLQPGDDTSRRALSGMLICDISTAQEVLGEVGHLSRIDLRMDDASAARLAASLGSQVRLEDAHAQADELSQITRSFELNLSAVSLLVLIVGTFLVYNTVTFFVVGRRPLLGMLRTLGVTRGQIFMLVLGETAVLGAAGAALGIGLGWVLGQGAIRLETRTINDLYFVLTATDTSISWGSLLRGAAVGMVASLLSALVPAREAAAVPPGNALQRSVLETHVSSLVPWLSLAGALLLAVGVALLRAPGQGLRPAFVGLGMLFVGAALLVPLGTTWLLRCVAPLGDRWFGLPGQLAPRAIVRSLSRTGVAVAALMVAVAIIVGIQIMIGSFRETLVDWLGNTLTADVFVRSEAATFSRSDAFDPRIADEVAHFPGVAAVYTARSLRIDEPRYGIIHLMALSGDIASRRRFLWAEGDIDHVWQLMQQGAVLASQPFAYRHGLRDGPGQTVELQTDAGSRSFPVAGIYYDYGTERGEIMLADAIYRRWWSDRNITSVAAWLRPGVDVEGEVAALTAHFKQTGRELQVQSNRTLRQAALTVFERTFAITGALRFLVALVAFIGVLSTLMALQFERVREVATLRALGLTLPQLWGAVLFETGLLGLAAGLFALPVGTLLAWSLIFVINPRSFGWTIAFLPRGAYYAEALGLAVAAGLLAGLGPAWRFSKMDVAASLRVE